MGVCSEWGSGAFIIGCYHLAICLCMFEFIRVWSN